MFQDAALVRIELSRISLRIEATVVGAHERSALAAKIATVSLAEAFDPTGERVVTGSEDNTARIWDARTGQPLGTPMQHKNAVLAVAFSPSGGWALLYDKNRFAAADIPDSARRKLDEASLCELDCVGDEVAQDLEDLDLIGLDG